MNARWMIAVTLSAVCAATIAHAETVVFVTPLSGENEVPPVQTSGKGTATVTADTASRAVQWEVVVQGLSGPISASHFHCPAAAGQNAPVSIPISGAGVESPLKGSATISAEQMDNLLGGRCYVNVHTAQHPPGEIRGQVVRR
jgi:hypothetical protein